jgi:hypothetical protein
VQVALQVSWHRYQRGSKKGKREKKAKGLFVAAPQLIVVGSLG